HAGWPRDWSSDVCSSDLDSWKKRKRTSQYPVLEQYLVEWVDRTNQKHISINDFILRATAEKLIAKLEALPSHSEHYLYFEMSNAIGLASSRQSASITVAA